MLDRDLEERLAGLDAEGLADVARILREAEANRPELEAASRLVDQVLAECALLRAGVDLA